MSITKLYVKLRDSGEVFKVLEYHEPITIKVEVLGDWIRMLSLLDCDLCDEQGRLLKPEDPTQALKDELLENYRELRIVGYDLPRWKWLDCNIEKLEAKLKQLNTETP